MGGVSGIDVAATEGVGIYLEGGGVAVAEAGNDGNGVDIVALDEIICMYYITEFYCNRLDYWVKNWVKII